MKTDLAIKHSFSLTSSIYGCAASQLSRQGLRLNKLHEARISEAGDNVRTRGWINVAWVVSTRSWHRPLGSCRINKSDLTGRPVGCPRVPKKYRLEQFLFHHFPVFAKRSISRQQVRWKCYLRVCGQQVFSSFVHFYPKAVSPRPWDTLLNHDVPRFCHIKDKRCIKWKSRKTLHVSLRLIYCVRNVRLLELRFHR